MHDASIKENGCTGGTSKSISFVGKEEVFEGHIYYCGGEKYGSLKGNINDFAQEFTTFFLADLKAIIRSTRQ